MFWMQGPNDQYASQVQIEGYPINGPVMGFNGMNRVPQQGNAMYQQGMFQMPEQGNLNQQQQMSQIQQQWNPNHHQGMVEMQHQWNPNHHEGMAEMQQQWNPNQHQGMAEIQQQWNPNQHQGMVEMQQQWNPNHHQGIVQMPQQGTLNHHQGMEQVSQPDNLNHNKESQQEQPNQSNQQPQQGTPNYYKGTLQMPHQGPQNNHQGMFQMPPQNIPPEEMLVGQPMQQHGGSIKDGDLKKGTVGEQQNQAHPMNAMPYQPFHIQSPQMQYNSQGNVGGFYPPERPPYQQLNGMGPFFPYPAQQKQAASKKQPSQVKSIFSQFKSGDGNYDINKMMNTAGTAMNTMNQIGGMVKQVGQFFLSK